jgi:hypothetical protein
MPHASTVALLTSASPGGAPGLLDEFPDLRDEDIEVALT